MKEKWGQSPSHPGSSTLTNWICLIRKSPLLYVTCENFKCSCSCINAPCLGAFCHFLYVSLFGEERNTFDFCLDRSITLLEVIILSLCLKGLLLFPMSVIHCCQIRSVFFILTQIIFLLSFNLTLHSASAVCTHQGLSSVD